MAVRTFVAVARANCVAKVMSATWAAKAFRPTLSSQGLIARCFGANTLLPFAMACNNVNELVLRHFYPFWGDRLLNKTHLYVMSWLSQNLSANIYGFPEQPAIFAKGII